MARYFDVDHPKHHKHPFLAKFLSLYFYIPILLTLTWLAELLGLLLLWIVSDNSRRYEDTEAGVVYISDTGGAHKWFFIPMSAVTAGLFLTTLFAERFLRHIDRLPGTVRTRERWYDIFAIIFGMISMAGLVLLSVFDTFRHSGVHWSMTIVFIVGLAISAIFSTLELTSLATDHPERNHLRRNGLLKIFIVSLSVMTAIAFGVTYAICGGDAGPNPPKAQKCQRVIKAAAILEWATAVIVVFYFATFILDLWPAAKTSPRYLRRYGQNVAPEAVMTNRYSADPLMAERGREHSTAGTATTNGAEYGGYAHDRVVDDHANQSHFPTMRQVPVGVEGATEKHPGYSNGHNLEREGVLAGEKAGYGENVGADGYQNEKVGFHDGTAYPHGVAANMVDSGDHQPSTGVHDGTVYPHGIAATQDHSNFATQDQSNFATQDHSTYTHPASHPTTDAAATSGYTSGAAATPGQPSTLEKPKPRYSLEGERSDSFRKW